MGQSRIWVPIVAALLLAALTVGDVLTGEDVVLVPLYVLAPLLAALAASTRATVAIAVAAGVCGIVVLATLTGFGAAQEVVRLATVVLGAAVAVWVAVLRERLRSTASLLDVIFERAPVGLAVLDSGVRYVRVNERLADALPDLPPEVHADVQRVMRTGEPLTDVTVRAEREFLVSYWPVRRPGDDDVVGVGMVVSDVTERRAAERALRAQTDRYEALLLALSDAGEGLLVLERDGRCVYANAAFEQLTGYTFPELAAMETVLDVVVEYEHEERRRAAVARLDQGLVTPALPLTVRRRDGALVDVEVGGVRLDIEGRRQLVVVVRDVTDRRRAEVERERLLARSALLAEASELFDQSLDEQATLGSVARLCIRELAQTCVILLGGESAPVASASRAPDGQHELLAALDHAPEHPMATVMRSGHGVIAGTAVVVPLIARGRVYGVLAAGFDRTPDSEDRALFEDLGRRAALALDSARLYAERDHVASTLQRSLLPRELPDIPGVEIAARYVAAGAGNEVGGDFYDCFPTGAGDWALVIGDVCGKGAEAAAVTALARYTLRAAALHTRRPSAVLEQLNEALLRQRLDYRFCTVLYVSLTPRGDRVTADITAGGHPLPLVLRAGGTVAAVGSPGTVLGVVAVPELAEERVELHSGDSLVLYTDGVTEADRAAGPERLATLLERCAGAAPAAIAETVERAALHADGVAARDDVAVVVVRATGPPVSFDPTSEGVATAT